MPAALGSRDQRHGLSSAEAAERLREVGPNELTGGRSRPLWRLLLTQFGNTMVMVLVAAAVITALIGETKDTIVIGAIVVLNALAGAVQEHRAEQAMAALRKLAADEAVIVRDGQARRAPAADVVPGDLLLLATGDIVPADLRLIEAHALQIDEAALTGESMPATKDAAGAIGTGSGAGLLGDRTDMAFKGTVVTAGRGAGVVEATGMRTELGRVATLIAAQGDEATPLQRRLAAVGRQLAVAALAVCGIVFVAGLARGEAADEMFLTAVSLAVAAIPEGLPAVVTVALALGARRMSERSALVRKLPAVETLGSVTVICTDKTGTLTQNRMVVERVWTPSGEYLVSGSGYEPSGSLVGMMDPSSDEHLVALAEVAVACNDAVLEPPSADEPGWRLTGDPTEGALLALAGKVRAGTPWPGRPPDRVTELAFDADRRRMTTVHLDRTGQAYWVATKGALESVGRILADDDQAVLGLAREVAERWAADGLRVLALAERRVRSLPVEPGDVERGARLVGIVGITDPPRPEAAEAIARCRSAGIMPVMITGDHLLTATAIAARLGFPVAPDGALTGDQLEALDDEELTERVTGISVYARTSPEQKLRIVDAWKRRGAVVAMTGDGVNDAPALRRADIGVAMGRAGSDVSKEAADMVLADDNFATIVAAVAEGRRIYDNLRRFVRYLLTTNSGEVLAMFLAPILGLPLPLLPVQILWTNLVTDGLPAIALGLERGEPDTMARAPRPPDEPVFARGLGRHALRVGLLMALVVLVVEAGARAAGWEWRTMVFTTMAFLQLGHALAVRSEHQSFFALGPTSNPWLLGAVGLTALAQTAIVYAPPLQDAFGTRALGLGEIAVVSVASSVVFVAVEIGKWTARRQTPASSGRPLAEREVPPAK